MADQNLLKWVAQLAGQRIIVVGDVFLDEYVVGRANRLSREAPIPVLELESRRFIPGGAANPAANIASLGSEALLLGVVGQDAMASTLCAVLPDHQIAPDSLAVDPNRPTTVKTRIMAQMGLRFPQQIARVDTLSRQPISSLIELRLTQRFDELLPTVGAVLVSDYQTGLLTTAVVDHMRLAATRAPVLLTVDAQGQLEKYHSFGLMKCNADEAREYLRRSLHTHEDFAAAARELCGSLALTVGMVITRGAEGATVALADGSTHHCPAPAVSDVYDIVGAGDTTIAVLTLALSAGASVVEATTLANYASGIVVRHVGNYAPTADELRHALRG
jgi:D-glycero-beta-D-manno-heptose-7-phosphate kinase